MEKGISTNQPTYLSGSIEQVILSHPSISEASVVGIPDSIKGHLPFAFITLHSGPNFEPDPLPAKPSPKLVSEINTLIRSQIGAIATLGGIIQGRGMIPKTRSGKTLRRVLRELLERGAKGDFEALKTDSDEKVGVPPTIEDVDVVSVVRGRVWEYFSGGGVEKAKL